MSRKLLDSFLEAAQCAGITHLNPRAEWRVLAPEAPGKWWMRCGESSGEPELITVEYHNNKLWAIDSDVGTIRIQELHERLTDCQWQPEENAYLPEAK